VRIKKRKQTVDQVNKGDKKVRMHHSSGSDMDECDDGHEDEKLSKDVAYMQPIVAPYLSDVVPFRLDGRSTLTFAAVMFAVARQGLSFRVRPHGLGRLLLDRLSNGLCVYVARTPAEKKLSDDLVAGESHVEHTTDGQNGIVIDCAMLRKELIEFANGYVEGGVSTEGTAVDGGSGSTEIVKIANVSTIWPIMSYRPEEYDGFLTDEKKLMGFSADGYRTRGRGFVLNDTPWVGASIDITFNASSHFSKARIANGKLRYTLRSAGDTVRTVDMRTLAMDVFTPSNYKKPSESLDATGKFDRYHEILMQSRIRMVYMIKTLMEENDKGKKRNIGVVKDLELGISDLMRGISRIFASGTLITVNDGGTTSDSIDAYAGKVDQGQFRWHLLTSAQFRDIGEKMVTHAMSFCQELGSLPRKEEEAVQKAELIKHSLAAFSKNTFMPVDEQISGSDVTNVYEWTDMVEAMSDSRTRNLLQTVLGDPLQLLRTFSNHFDRNADRPDFNPPGLVSDKQGGVIICDGDSIVIRNARSSDLVLNRLPYDIDYEWVRNTDIRFPFDDSTSDTTPMATFKGFVDTFENAVDREAMQKLIHFIQLVNPYEGGPKHFVEMCWDMLIGNYITARFHILQPPFFTNNSKPTRAGGFMKSSIVDLLIKFMGELMEKVHDSHLATPIDPSKNQQLHKLFFKHAMYVDEGTYEPLSSNMGILFPARGERSKLTCKTMNKDCVTAKLSLGGGIVATNVVAKSLSEKGALQRRAVFHPLKYCAVPKASMDEFNANKKLEDVTDVNERERMSLVEDPKYYIVDDMGGDPKMQLRMARMLGHLAVLCGRGRGWAKTRTTPPEMRASTDEARLNPNSASVGATPAPTGDEDTDFVNAVRANMEQHYRFTGDKKDVVLLKDFLKNVFHPRLAPCYIDLLPPKAFFDKFVEMGVFGECVPTFHEALRIGGNKERNCISGLLQNQ
jgi:hypothetical protein